MFSETHVLSLLYAGELCYWHIKHNKQSTAESGDASQSIAQQQDEAGGAAQDTQTEETVKEKKALETKPSRDTAAAVAKCVSDDEATAFSSKECGGRLLRLYLDVVQGPLKNHGWMLERANELLAYIDKSNDAEKEEVKDSS